MDNIVRPEAVVTDDRTEAGESPLLRRLPLPADVDGGRVLGTCDSPPFALVRATPPTDIACGVL